MFDLAVIFLVLTAAMAYVNVRFIRLPSTIGVMAIAMGLSLIVLGLDRVGISALKDYEVSLLSSLDFSDVLMQGMLSLLLFAGAMHVDLSELKAYRWQIGALAVFGTLLSTALIGASVWLLLPWIGIELPLIYCLLFGALISPTDPIAVMGIVKSAGAPKNLELMIAGESLFNDGVGVVVFTVLLAAATSGQAPEAAQVGILVAEEVGGGILFGLLLGAITYHMLKSIDSYAEEVLITLAAVLGGYALATHLHVSGPLAMVVAGLIVGNHGRAMAMSHKTREYLDMFWDLIDAMLNAVLFVLIGLEIVLIEYAPGLALAVALVIAVTLLARLVAVGAPVALFHRRFRLPDGAWKVLTWGGLRGGISVALALSLPAGAERDLVLALTYAVVVASIFGQGMTVGAVVRKAIGRPAD
ncbi:cation:proton antiporter [Denitromonas ohlonensis]|uniref:Sodium:proton antiporter n=2 Tax=Denitromonas TaxID=139331 RepID=A0A557S653_9RHOO|nr:sodium:proton antiporter [Denitromonas ohlonensis]TVO68749.1 sodium:proton antiporter [Denitromonas ohlonensis]TVO72885.1 sodium:proton antiporter [Denitromonas ohlonensis]